MPDPDTALDAATTGTTTTNSDELTSIGPTPDGTFAPATSYWTSIHRGLAVGDVDGDGKSDVFAADDDGLHLLRSCP